ncbi:MAG: 4-phosphoerythronate dehydrogenase [Mariprofundaceae bacterium]|nr:4-phosphoerythronate dehydrogenase [Mariprofundaceae bacterium]
MALKPLKIIADEHIWGVQSACAHLSGYDVDLCVLPPKDITAETVKDIDILLTRTGTKVNGALLAGSNVRFAGTATIGDDHYDKTWLDAHGVAWATAAGSSTGSVLEYILAALLELHMQHKIDLSLMVLGVIGAGRIGGQLVNICRALGIKVLVNDPPRQRLEGDEGFVSLSELLCQADIITLHTPLISEGQDKTYHLLDDVHLKSFQGKVVINAARGACVDNTALLAWMNRKQDVYAVLDCWEGEPNISRELLGHKQCVIATPHIAGHSLDGKAANTQYIYEAMCDYLKVEPVWHMSDDLPDVSCLHDEPLESWSALHDKVSGMYCIKQDHRALVGCANLDRDALAEKFIYLRRHYPIRRAWDKQSQVLSQVLKARYSEVLR